ncbi:spike base protein, RCAP_Rcc01079 family [Geminicoccus harenae]|uniref:spike base protein, RCAP_Rcc01079 family n=1 Tax=Geminicoccus harenae TaxID=2498453 RepID=UPI00168B8721|nr:hypothetical protein [Geminicoccus harenae]
MARPGNRESPDSTSPRWRPIVPHDDNLLQDGETRAIYVGSTGDVVAIDERGVEVTFKNAQAGSSLPIRTARVKATGTTAGFLVGLF